jgi:hypothetical protein
MSRRLQFSLTTLLVVTAVIASFFGGWRLFASHAQYVAVKPDPSTDLLTINGRIVRFLGPRTIDCVVALTVVAHDDHVGAQIGDQVVERHWLCVYPIEIETDLLASDFSRFGAMVSTDHDEINSFAFRPD